MLKPGDKIVHKSGENFLVGKVATVKYVEDDESFFQMGYTQRRVFIEPYGTWIFISQVELYKEDNLPRKLPYMEGKI